MNFISLNVFFLLIFFVVNKDLIYVFKREINVVIKFWCKIKLFELNEVLRFLKDIFENEIIYILIS